ncbi:MAG: gamma-glutamyltransferase [Acidimicrobiales bacterium]
MSVTFAPFPTRRAANGMVCSVDHLASEAGVAVLRDGGNAVDAAVAASAVLAVTSQYMCGMGGDLFAIVHDGRGAPKVLNSSGFSGSGADAETLRGEGHSLMPPRGDIRSVPVPGCVDGWMTLLKDMGRIGPERVLRDAIRLANDGFPVISQLVWAVGLLNGLTGADEYQGELVPGQLLKRPGIAQSLRDISTGGRAAFYQGAFGEGLLALGDGEYAASDLEQTNAHWVDPLSVDAFGHRLWTVPPNSQGYLTLSGAAVADGLDLPLDPNDPEWAHLLIESALAAGRDRNDVLHEFADGQVLLAPERTERLRSAIDTERASNAKGNVAKGGTIYLCAVDASGMGVSLIQSNAGGWGAHIVEPNTRIFLQNRGIGFSLESGHPAEYGPRRRPPHTLAPCLVTTTDNDLRAVLGAMGGDSQPQVLLQLLARLLLSGSSPAATIAAPRWVLKPRSATGFNAWAAPEKLQVDIEGHAPAAWTSGLEQLGHTTHMLDAFSSSTGHAHLIDLQHGTLAGAADPRAEAAAAVGY